MTIDVISRYDDKGPAWYWNTLRFGEHTGTHFDAPIHWITGKDLPDNACDTIPAAPLRRTGLRDRRRARGRAQPDFLLTPQRIDAVGSGARPHSRGVVGAAAHRLEPPHRSRGVPQCRRRRPAQPGLHASAVDGCSRTIATSSASASRRSAPTRARPAPSIRRSRTTHHARRRQVRPGQPVQPRSAAATGAVVIAAPLKIVNGSGSPLRVLAIVAKT